jgi:3-oxoisoapionate kinase
MKASGLNTLLLSFYGDDFTGSTDAMEALTLAGVRTVLFTNPPTRAQLDRYPDLQAFGVAGMTRSMPPEEMEKVLRPAFQSLRDLGAPIVHYKVCSTFDSSPQIGSIGRAIDVGMDVLGSKCVPLVVGAPALGRYCVFGNLFARCGTETEPFRLDRHPSMSRHPVTPMNESDLRLHLSKQTSESIGLIDVIKLEGNPSSIADVNSEIVLIDLLLDRQLATVGRLIAEHAQREQPLFVVGSSGVESALAAYWKAVPAAFPIVAPVDRLLVLSGSGSLVTENQIAASESRGFTMIPFDRADAEEMAIRALGQQQSVVIHTLRGQKRLDPKQVLPRLACDLLKKTELRRVLVAGGDTSGAVARALGIESLEMIGPLTRGAPLCRATAPGSPADGIEVVFKGGQIGPVNFFEMVRTGKSDA